jgi:vitamin B12 transporter
MKRKFLMMAAVTSSIWLQAQKDTVLSKQLDDVIVTATKFQQKQNTTGKVVSVIDQATLQNNAGKTLTEIINYQAGIFINGANNNLGANQEVYLRGASVGNTLILIDGIPMSDPSQISNNFDLNNIVLGQVQRIEILKGAQSTLWGSDAVAGVINIITKTGANTNSFTPSALLSYGTYNTFRGNASVQGTIHKFNYNIGYNFTNSNGFSAAYDSTASKNFEKDKFTQNNIQANAGYQINTRLAATGSFGFSAYKAAIDAAAFADDKDNVLDSKNTVGNIGLSYSLAKLKLNFSQNFVQVERVFADDSASIGSFSVYSKGNYNGQSAITELFGNIALAKKLSLVSGVQYINQKTSQGYVSISAYGPFKTALGDSAKANNFSIYNSLLLTDVAGFNVEAGFRYNRHNIYGNNATYTFNPSYNVNANTRFFVNISSAYKIPSLYQLYSEYGNKKLKPETSNNYELGVQAFFNNKKNSFRLVGFKRDSKSLIIFYTDTLTYYSQYINRDEQHDYGIELETRMAIGKKGIWVNNFTYVDGKGKNENATIKNLYRRPNFTMNSVLTLEPAKGFTFMPSFRLVGTRLKGQYDVGPEQMPQYYTLDCYLAYQCMKKIDLFIDLRNITNQQYFDVPGYNSKRFNMMMGVRFMTRNE